MYPKQIAQMSRTFVKRETPHDETKRLIEKLAITLKLKHYSLFKENGYSVKELISDLTHEVKSQDYARANFDSYLNFVEKIIVNKANKGVSKKYKSQSQLKNTNLQKNESDRPSQKREEFSTEGFPAYRTKLVLENNLKKQDEWAKIASFNKDQFNEEIRMKKEKEKQEKLVIREYLNQQMKEKLKILEKVKDQDNNIHKEHLQLLDQFDKKEKEKASTFKLKLLKEKEERERAMLETMKTQNLLKHAELKEDKQVLDFIKVGLIEDEKKSKRRREEEKEMYRRLIQENERNKEIKREKKLLELAENSKYVLESIKTMERQEKEREEEKHRRLSKLKKPTENYKSSVSHQRNGLEALEEMKYFKNLIEKLEIENQKEKLESLKKKKMNEENKKGLDDQVYEKKRMAQTMREGDAKYGHFVSKNVQQFNEEKTKKMIQHQEQVKKYRNELETQINEKEKVREVSMDEKERLMNKSILDKIKY